MKIPQVNATVAAVRGSWERIEARRAARRAPGGGIAEPMSTMVRSTNYWIQTGRAALTPKQARRTARKYNRTLRALAGAVSE